VQWSREQTNKFIGIQTGGLPSHIHARVVCSVGENMKGESQKIRQR
jgi:hypothetical protein